MPKVRSSEARVAAVFAILLAAGCAAAPAERSRRTHTHYIAYIAAEEIDWSFAPGGIDRTTGEPLDSAALRSGRKVQRWNYRKARYVEYTDETFTTVKPRPAEWEHLGLLGPLVRSGGDKSDDAVLDQRLHLWQSAARDGHGRDRAAPTWCPTTPAPGFSTSRTTC